MLAPQILADSFCRPHPVWRSYPAPTFPRTFKAICFSTTQSDFWEQNNISWWKRDRLFTAKWRQDLFSSDDLNFRPVDLEFAPDGSLYVADWHNALIGHMQHNARDPLRDHVHGESTGSPIHLDH